MIFDQLFYTKDNDAKALLYKTLENILKEKACLVVLDALDEWAPANSGTKKERESIPIKVKSDKCVYLTTCRPYKIENIRLSRKDLDQQVKMTGLHGPSSKRYIREVVKHINKVNDEERNPIDFLMEVKQCELEEQISIPMIAAQLVVVWFDRKLTEMTRALIYSNIVEMLFQRAEQRHIEFPTPTTTSVVQPPGSLSDLFFISKHFPLLKEISFLSFKSLFQQDHNISVLVFTEQLLMKTPYCFTQDKIEFLCKIGILSKNKVIGRYAKKEHKLSFLHKSYIEFFAALYVLSFDTSGLFDSIVMEWVTINDVVQFQNVLVLLTGFSPDVVKTLLENIFENLSTYLRICKNNSLFHYNSESFYEQLKSLQSLVVKCFNETSQLNVETSVFKLEDFIMSERSNSELELRLLALNKSCVKSIHSEVGRYFKEFDCLETLECLHVGKMTSDDPLSDDNDFDRRIIDCMLRNVNTLCCVCIECNYTLLPELPLSKLKCLTSLSLNDVEMTHCMLQNLVAFFSSNSLFENIKLHDIACDEHKGNNCQLGYMNLSKHARLTSLCLNRVDIICDAVNSSSLLYLTLDPLSDRIFDSYVNIFDAIKGSNLEHLFIHGLFVWLDDDTMGNIITTVKTLPSIKSLKLYEMLWSEDILLEIHPDVSDAKIKLYNISMSSECFQSFIRTLRQTIPNTTIQCEMEWCKVKVEEDGSSMKLDKDKAVDYMVNYLESLDTKPKRFKITHDDDWSLYFKTVTPSS